MENVFTKRNCRSVWTIATQPFPEAHFATFPEAIPEKCIKAGSKVGDTIPDPFFGAGTVGLMAEKLNRKWIGILILANKFGGEDGLFLWQLCRIALE